MDVYNENQQHCTGCGRTLQVVIEHISSGGSNNYWTLYCGICHKFFEFGTYRTPGEEKPYFVEHTLVNCCLRIDAALTFDLPMTLPVQL